MTAAVAAVAARGGGGGGGGGHDDVAEALEEFAVGIDIAVRLIAAEDILLAQAALGVQEPQFARRGAVPLSAPSRLRLACGQRQEQV